VRVTLALTDPRARRCAQLPEADGLKARLQAMLGEQREAAAAREAGLRKQRDTVAALGARIADATATVARLNDEAKAKSEEIVVSVLNGALLQSFQELLTACEKKVADSSKKAADVQAFEKVMRKGIEHAHGKQACMLCMRPFDAAQQAEFVQQQTHKERHDMPVLRANAEAELAAASAELAALQRARPLWEVCQRLREHDIPKAEDVLKGCVRVCRVCALACCAGTARLHRGTDRPAPRTMQLDGAAHARQG
jgi:hypothetical protein